MLSFDVCVGVRRDACPGRAVVRVRRSDADARIVLDDDPNFQMDVAMGMLVFHAGQGCAVQSRLLVPMATGRSDLVAAFIQALMTPEMGLTADDRALILGIRREVSP